MNTKWMAMSIVVLMVLVANAWGAAPEMLSIQPETREQCVTILRQALAAEDFWRSSS